MQHIIKILFKHIYTTFVHVFTWDVSFSFDLADAKLSKFVSVHIYED